MADLHHKVLESNQPSRWRVGDLTLDTRRQRVWRGADEIPLPKLTYDLFATLVRRCPAVIPDEELMKDVWPGLIVSPETISQRVKLLRAALGDESRTPRYVGRLRGRGYHLVPMAEPAPEPSAQSPEILPGTPQPPAPDAPTAVTLSPHQELSLLESPARPAETQVIPEKAGVGRFAVRPALQSVVPRWVSWLLCIVALATTALVAYVLRLS